MLPKLPRNQLIEICRRMFLIRHFEERLIGLDDEGHVRGNFHVYIGQEATGVTAISCLRADDYLFTTHRNHGHLLARGAEPKRLLAEILGRSDGYNKGKGGNFHTAVASLGFFHTSAVVAGIIPLATGTAYASKAQKNGRLTVCLFGDGSLEEGAAAEALNIASLWKLPVLFLCENNSLNARAVAAGPSSSMAVYPLTDLPTAYKIPARQVDGIDAGAVHAVISETVGKIRRGEGPQFVEARTVDWSGSRASRQVVPRPMDTSLAWDVSSVPEKMREWYRTCDPLLSFIRELVESKEATRGEIVELEKGVKGLISEAVKFALASPYPKLEEATTDVFAGSEL